MLLCRLGGGMEIDMTNQDIISARRSLFARGARLPLALTVLLAGVMAMVLQRGLIALLTLIERLGGIYLELPELTEAALLWLLPMLAVLPIAYGAIPMAWRMCRAQNDGLRECTDGAELWHSLAMYRRPLGVAVSLLSGLIPTAMMVGVAVGFFAAWRYVDGFAIIEGSIAVSSAVHLGMTVVAVALEVLALLLSARLYTVPACVLRGDMRLRNALRAALGASRGQCGRIIVFRLRYVGWALLGLLSIGVLTVLRVIPCYYIEYNIFTDELLKGTKI